MSSLKVLVLIHRQRGLCASGMAPMAKHQTVPSLHTSLPGHTDAVSLQFSAVDNHTPFWLTAFLTVQCQASNPSKGLGVVLGYKSDSRSVLFWRVLQDHHTFATIV